MGYSFFAMLARMKYISRWALMRNTERESLSEHSLETAVLAHSLAILRNRRFGGSIDPDRVAVLALFHDTPEILTGDMPTPVKYFTPQLRSAYAEVEQAAGEKLLALLPEDLRPDYEPFILPDEGSDEHRLVKAADKLSALIKCIDERKAGNMEFVSAESAAREALSTMKLPEVDCFMEEFLEAYSFTLDEQSL